MSSKVIKKSTLFRTCAASDIQCAGGQVTIPGLNGAIWKKDITSISQIFYRAEVAQVVTVGGTTYTPASSTVYSVVVYDPLRNPDGYNEAMHKYTYVTPTDVTTLGTVAQQKEAISVALVAKINADQSNHAVAVTAGSGNGFTVTDDGGYYPAYALGGSIVKGVNSVFTVCNSDGSGYTGLTTATPLGNASLTTTGAYSYGVGATLAADKPIVDFVYGNVVSGLIEDAPLTLAGLPAVSGQKYNGFVIESYKIVDGLTLGGQFVYQVRINRVFADNGTGSDVTNLAGYKAFERVMHKLMVEVYGNDAATVQEWFDKPIVFQDPLGAAPTGTANTLGWQLSPYGSLNRTNIGTQTIVAPVLNGTGLLIDQDDTAGDGSHTSANQQALGDQSFIVGKTTAMVVARVVMGDWTDSHILVGFRKKAVYTADYNDYTDLGAIGSGAAAGDTITTTGILNNAATVATASAASYADAVSALLIIKVAIDGTVSAYVNGTAYPIYSTGTTTLIFDAGDEMIAFYQHVNIGSGDPAVSIGEFFAVNTDQLLS